MKDDETRLLGALLGSCRLYSSRVVIENTDIPWKRARYLLRNKWCTRGVWDYGIHWSLGWFVDVERARRAYLHRTWAEKETDE